MQTNFVSNGYKSNNTYFKVLCTCNYYLKRATLLNVYKIHAVNLVLLLFSRKRRKAGTEKNTNISIEHQNVTSGVSSGRISGTDRTYDLPEEEEYSTTDGNGLAQSSCELDNYGYIVPAVAMRADDTEYDVPLHVDGGEEHAYSILDKVDQQ